MPSSSTTFQTDRFEREKRDVLNVAAGRKSVSEWHSRCPIPALTFLSRSSQTTRKSRDEPSRSASLALLNAPLRPERSKTKNLLLWWNWFRRPFIVALLPSIERGRRGACCLHVNTFAELHLIFHGPETFSSDLFPCSRSRAQWFGEMTLSAFLVIERKEKFVPRVSRLWHDLWDDSNQ